MIVNNKKYATVKPGNKIIHFGKENGKDDLSYMVKESIGNVDFYKCKKCPYLALSIKDIKFHWQTVHIPTESENKKKEDKSIRIKCPGCWGIFHLESSLMVHLRSHHKMAPKDIPKLVSSLVKEAERKKEYIEKLDVVIGNFKYEDQTPFEGTVIASVIEVPPDPIISENELQIFNHETYGGTAQTLNLSNNEQYDLNLNLAENTARQISHPEGLISHGVQNGGEVFLLRGQHLINTSLLDANISHTHKPGDVISNISEAKPTNAKKSPPKKKISNNVSKKNRSKVIKKTLPLKKTTLVISNNKNAVSGELNSILPDKQKCNIQGCSAKLVSDENMAYHISCHLNNTNELFCAECKKPATSVESLHSHLWSQHKIDLEMQSCDQCSYKTFKISHLNKYHKTIHSEIKAYTCEVCAKDFKNSKQLANHKISHKEMPPARSSCDICNRDFKSKRYLLAHKRTVHQKEVSFYCEKCEYAAATKSSLFLHSKSHSDDKPFECDQCMFKTAIRSSLRRHLQRHTQNRKYNCEHCAYTCIQTSSLKRHFLSKHPGVQFDRLHLCPFCSYKTVNKDNFTVHMSTHTKDKPRKSIPRAARVEVVKPENEESDLVKNKSPPAKMENMDVIDDLAMNSSHFFYSTTEGIEIMSDVENDKSDINNTTNTELNSEQDASSHEMSKTMNLLQQEDDDLYYHLPEESHEISLVTKSIKDILNSAANKVNKSQMFQQCMSTTNIQMANKNPTFPIILVKPRSQMCSETDNINSLTLRSFTPQLLNIPLQNNQCEPNMNDSLPRKKPKISVKSNLILKGPDNVDSFNLQPQGKSRCSLLNQPFSTDEHNPMQYHTAINANSSQNENVLPISKLISRDPFMSDNSVLPNYLLTSNFFSNLHMPNISNDTLLIQASSDASQNKAQNMRNSISTPTETNQPSDLSDIKIENKPYIPPQSELSCTSLNDNASGSGSLIYEIPKHTIPIKFENKSDILGSYIYQDELYQDSENALNQMQNVSIIEELPASFENSNGIINPHGDPHPYSDNFVEMLDEDEIIIVDDTSCEMKSIPNFTDDSNFGLQESEQFYNCHVQNMPVPLISSLDEGNSNNNRKHVKEKPRIISEVHISSDKSKIMNFEAVKNLGLKLEFPSIQNIEWTLALLNDQHQNKG